MDDSSCFVKQVGETGNNVSPLSNLIEIDWSCSVRCLSWSRRGVIVSEFLGRRCSSGVSVGILAF